MYKFEIYKSTLKTPITFDFVEFNRYDIGSYAFEREISPIWNDLAIDGERENGRVFFREKLDGSITLVDSDYSWAYSAFVSEYDSNKYRYIKISEKIDGVWTQIWRGFFNVTDGEYDLDRCRVEFSDLLVFDEYSSIIENIQREKNLIDIAATAQVNYNANQYPYDQIITTSTETSSDSACTFVNDGLGQITTGLKYVLVEREILHSNAKGFLRDTGCSYTVTVTYKNTYRRDYQYADSDPGIDWDDSGETSDTGVTKWVRYYRNNPSPSYGLKKIAKNIQTNVSWQEFIDYGCCSQPYYDHYYTSNADAESEITNERGRLFVNMISYIIDDMVDYYNPNNILDSKFNSQFLLDNINPITGASNTLQNLVVWQLSDMKPTSDAATIGMYSLQDIENFLLIFDSFWYLDSVGRFKVEHLKYFKKGLSYTGNSIGLDISSDDRISGKKKISYIEDLPQEERHKFLYSVNRDFVGVPIRFYGNIVNRDEDSSVKEYNFNKIATDLTQVVSNPSEVGNEGFFIATTTPNGSELDVDIVSGILSDIEIYNGYLSVSYLQDYYWKYWRSLPSGMMNGVITEFTQKNVILQEDVVVTNCDTFNPYKLVRTNYGDGFVEKYTKTLKEKKLTLTLSYEA